MSVPLLPPVGKSTVGYATWQANQERLRQEAAARAGDPVEQAVRYIRSRGRTIFRADVDGGPADHWRYAGQLLTRDQVITTAEQIRTVADQLRAARAPAPIVPKIAPAPVPPAAPAALSRPAPSQETNMADAAELARCKARGTTPKAVMADLKRIDRSIQPKSRVAELLGCGSSTFSNALHGHAPIREGLMTALYGGTGCTLRPPIAAALQLAEQADRTEVAAVIDAVTAPQSPAPLPAPVAAAEQLDVADEARHTEACLDADENPPAVPVIFGSPEHGQIRDALFGPLPPAAPRFAPELLRLNVGHLLANAEAERERLSARLAEIDRQIEAVHALAAAGAAA